MRKLECTAIELLNKFTMFFKIKDDMEFKSDLAQIFSYNLYVIIHEWN